MAAALSGQPLRGPKRAVTVPVLARGLAMGLGLGLALAVVAGCAPIGPDPSHATRDDSPAARLDSLVSQDRRVAEIAWRLATANAPLCPVVRPRAGWALQSANQYGPALRALAIARFGLDGDLPGLLASPHGSPADRANLAEGDLILAVDGHPLSTGGTGGAESFDGLAANLAVLTQAEAGGVLNLTVRRGGRERAVTLQTTPACAYIAQIEASADLNGRSDGRHIFITSGLVEVARNDDELAFFLAHEMAHAVLEHHTVPDVTGTRGAENALITLRRGLSATAEQGADRAGLYLLARAGYDPQAAIQALAAYEAAAPMNRFAQMSLSGALYPSPAARRLALESAVQDIARRQRDSLPLIP